MDFIAGWIIRLCELRDAIAQSQVTGFTLIPNFLSALQARVRDVNIEGDHDYTMAEYAIAVVALVLAAFAAYYSTGNNIDGASAALTIIVAPLRFT
jgi:hypothetical protein